MAHRNADSNVVAEIRLMFERNGSSLYGGEAVTQLEHALQAATLAESSGATSSMIVAALLHDIGHLLHDLPEDAPDSGVDDAHEELAYRWLSDSFRREVTEPIRMHVAAKRYLCAVDPQYQVSLSPPSQQSLELQGGPFTSDEVREFESHPFFDDGLRLRHWDDLAKVVGLSTPDLDHFLRHVVKVRPAQKPAEVTS